MARPNKDGLDYFPLDIDFSTNAKTEAIMGEFGAKGVLFMIYLLSAVYRKGYYLQWDKLQQMQLVNRVNGLSPEMTDQIVARLVAYGTFDKELFSSVRVLTSQRIQDTYLDATKRRKQPKPTLYWINVNNNSSSEGVNVDINPQSKGKKSKVNKSNKNPSRPKRDKPVYDENSDYLKLAEFLFEKIQDNDPQAKKPNLQHWADDMRKLVELDKRDKHEVSVIIKWCQQDPFWSTNILSAAKLRKQFTMLALQKKNEGKTRQSKVTRKETLPDWADHNQQCSNDKQKDLTDDQKAKLAEQLAELNKTEVKGDA
ncbi:DUF4373 domain-containing protein [Lentilactobacillus kisonensis]|uniref:Lin1244/Lin1753-like N-terminal domain-containing protein n=2 Tax=Lentilactobacillus kisonensis TaxID=481722 RepID=A0A0R1NVW5_9LACO|nr:DUF4373 domain-containing protein [Lentilactobacillus kisonensis]KRL21877.1 hypothetical protein FC98_GL000432 [Lentilactobacillus kisonensis DSM 19906 = JCM 15041]